MFPSQGVDNWTPTGGVETLEECNQAVLTVAENSAHKFNAQSKRGTRVEQSGAAIEIFFASGERASITFVCLPDTLDPRKSK
jgi:hypothetical protein